MYYLDRYHLTSSFSHRCQDPTELGTYLSALKCIKCQVGYYLGKNFNLIVFVYFSLFR